MFEIFKHSIFLFKNIDANFFEKYSIVVEIYIISAVDKKRKLGQIKTDCDKLGNFKTY